MTIEVKVPSLPESVSDGTLGPAGAQEWQAFVRDSEGNVIGLVEHRGVGSAAGG